jgi:hypothetical protein
MAALLPGKQPDTSCCTSNRLGPQFPLLKHKTDLHQSPLLPRNIRSLHMLYGHMLYGHTLYGHTLYGAASIGAFTYLTYAIWRYRHRDPYAMVILEEK